MEEVVNIHSWKLSVWLSSLHGSHPLRTSLRLTRAGAGAWAAPPPSPRRSPSPPAPPCGPCVVWGGGEHSRTSSPPSHLRPLPPSARPSSAPAPRVLGFPASHPFRRPAAGRVPLSRPRGTRRWEGNSSLRERESRAKGTNAKPSQLQAVGSCPGRTHGAGLWTPLELPPHQVPLEGSGAGRGEVKGFCCLLLPFAWDLLIPVSSGKS